MSINDELQKIRDRLINITIATAGIFLIVALIPSVSRFYEIGWHPIFMFHIGISFALIFLFIARKRIPLKIKAHAFFILFLSVSIVGIIHFQTAGGAFIALVVICISTLVCGVRSGILYASVFILLFSLIGYLHVKNILRSDIDFNVYLNNKTTWLTHIMAYLFTIIILISTIDLFYRFFINALKRSKAKSDELLNTLEALKLSENRYRSIFQGSKDGFIFVDEKFRIIKCNESYLELIGYSFEELEGKDYKFLMNKEDVDWDTYFLSLADMQDNKAEVETIHKSGEIIPVEVSVYKEDYYDTIFLWAVVRDLREKKALEEKVFNTMILAEENERERYAKELHDGLGPLLSTSMIYINALIEEQDSGLIKEYSDRAYSILEDATRTVKEISNNLSPVILREYGITQAVRSFIEKIQRSTDIQFTINSNIEGLFSETVQFTIYRIIIELINNSIKYSGAANVKTEFKYTNKELKIFYTDDGKGFDYSTVLLQKKGFGLLNLENRVKRLGGVYTYSTSEGKGIKVSISLKTEYV